MGSHELDEKIAMLTRFWGWDEEPTTIFFGPKFMSATKNAPKWTAFCFKNAGILKTPQKGSATKIKKPNGPKMSPNCANELSSKGPTDQGTSRLSTERSASVEFTTLATHHHDSW